MRERTLIIVKPGYKTRRQEDERMCCENTDGLLPELMRGLTLIRRAERVMPKKFWQELYSCHEKKAFFAELIEYVSSGRVMVIMAEGEDAIKIGRRNVEEARRKRGKSGKDTVNIAHASDSIENAEREIEVCEKFLPKQFTGYGT